MSLLFEPFELGGLGLPNRIVRSALYQGMASPEGEVTEELLSAYRALSRGGSGLLITGSAYVSLDGRSGGRMLSAADDSTLSGLRKLSSILREGGGRGILQLFHAGRQTTQEFTGGKTPLAPSELEEPTLGTRPRALTEGEVEGICDAFASAARRAREAGFDGIELHAAHGYLLSQFLSPHTNRREDKWGGSLEGRLRILLEIRERTGSLAGEDFPVLVKINTEDGIPGGLEPEGAAGVAERLLGAGFSAVELSGGMFEAGDFTVRKGLRPKEEEAYFLDAAREIRKRAKGPLILVGGVRSRSVAEGILAEGAADLISLGRPLTREPDLPLLWQEGKEGADCISCNLCIMKVMRGLPNLCYDFHIGALRTAVDEGRLAPEEAKTMRLALQREGKVPEIPGLNRSLRP
ncbi:MAG: NADH:flavin oxidoreductase [Nitrospinota bacterium]